MSRVLELLEHLISASAEIPGPEADPEDVLTVVERVMDARKSAFSELEAAVEAGLEVTEDMRAAAARLQKIDAAWRERVDLALRTITSRLAGQRRLRYAQGADAGPTGAHANLQV